MERTYTWCDGKRLEVTAKTLIMGILNVTPDSFSDGGRWNTAEKAQSHTREMTDAGADIIDVGAESTRPGGQPLTAEEEIKRMKIFLPVVLRESSVPVSVDTYHWKTADYALHAGAHMMNDIWGLQYDHGEMAEVAGCHQVPVIVMHNKADTNYNGDIIEEMKIFFDKSLDIALQAGVKEENIILDPGIGFGKDGNQNMEVLRRLDELRVLIDIIDESLRIFAHTEEICLFLRRLYRASAVRAFAVYDLGLGPEGLTRGTVKSLIAALVNIALIIELLENLLYLRLMILVGGADKFVVGCIHQIPDRLDLTRHVIDKLLRRDASLICL